MGNGSFPYAGIFLDRCYCLQCEANTGNRSDAHLAIQNIPVPYGSSIWNRDPAQKTAENDI